MLLLIFLALIAASSAIGWIANSTVTSVYDEAVRKGFTHVANPFSSVPPLFFARNAVIYIVLLGALLAIVLGVTSTLRDRKSKVIDLVLSRPINTYEYLVAKLAGLAVWVLGILIISAAVNFVGVSLIIGKSLAGIEIVRLVEFYLLAWLFLIPFIALGMISGGVSKSETGALLVPITIYSLIAFVLPQLGTAQNPTALLNPVPSMATSQGLFFDINRIIFLPLSITEHFKNVSAYVMHDSLAKQNVIFDFIVILAFAVISAVAVSLISRRHFKGVLYE